MEVLELAMSRVPLLQETGIRTFFNGPESYSYDGRKAVISTALSSSFSSPTKSMGLARAMIDEGVLERFPINEVYAIHNLPDAPMGHVSTRVGQICASESLFEITITGQGGHASMPHLGVDAITVGAEMVMALQTIVARKLPPSAGAVVSVTEFLTDGQHNVLPGTATLKGDVRAREPEDRLLVERFMRQIVDGVAATHGVTATMSFDTVFIEAINAQEPTQAVVRAARSAGLEVDGTVRR